MLLNFVLYHTNKRKICQAENAEYSPSKKEKIKDFTEKSPEFF